jgi:hypothetical protein
MVLTKYLESAISTVAGNSIFTQTLGSYVSVLAPSVSAEAALAVGGDAQAARALLSPGSPELSGLILAFFRQHKCGVLIC